MHTDIPITAIRTLLSVPEDLAKFVIKGRVTRYLPSTISDFSRRYCINCQQSAPLRLKTCAGCHEKFDNFTFMFTLDISDGIDTINVIVSHHDATRFLNGLVACELSHNSTVLEYLQGCMDKLIQSPLPTCFCIKSYRTPNGRRYRLFDTLLAIQ